MSGGPKTSYSLIKCCWYSMMLIISLAKTSKRSKGNCGGERILICGFYSCAQILQNMKKLNPKMHMQFYFQLKSFDWCEHKLMNDDNNKIWSR